MDGKVTKEENDISFCQIREFWLRKELERLPSEVRAVKLSIDFSALSIENLDHRIKEKIPKILQKTTK